MKLTELYQYIKSGRFSTNIMFNFKKIRSIEILRREDGSGQKILMRLFFDEKAKINRSSIYRFVCHAVEQEILESVENGKLSRFTNDFYCVDVFYWDENHKLCSMQIVEDYGSD